jgi:hypothetical protein
MFDDENDSFDKSVDELRNKFGLSRSVKTIK